MLNHVQFLTIELATQEIQMHVLVVILDSFYKQANVLNLVAFQIVEDAIHSMAMCVNVVIQVSN